MNFRYKTQGTCSQYIDIEIDDNNILQNVTYYGGCNGNLKGISTLVKGMDVNTVIEKLQGIRCGFKSTSCPDQLAQALIQYLNNKG